MAGWVRLRGPLQVRPCKLGRRIHAAHAPATGPTPPSTDFRDLSGRHGVRSVFRRKTDLTPNESRYLTDVSTKVDTHQQPQGSVRGGAVWGAGPLAPWMAPSSPHGRVYGVSCPPHRPAIPRIGRCCRCRCRCVEQVQGATLPNNPIPRPGTPRSASVHRSARDAACPSASAAPATAHPPACPATGPAGCAPGSVAPAAGR